MRFARSGVALSVVAAVALALAGCGDNNSSSGSSGKQASVDCGGKKVLKDSGSTAQQNAIEQFVYAYVRACPGYTLDYDANGSGAGVTEFLNNQTDLAGSMSRWTRPPVKMTGRRSGAVRRPGICPRCSDRSRSPIT